MDQSRIAGRCSCWQGRPAQIVIEFRQRKFRWRPTAGKGKLKDSEPNSITSKVKQQESPADTTANTNFRFVWNIVLNRRFTASRDVQLMIASRKQNPRWQWRMIVFPQSANSARQSSRAPWDTKLWRDIQAPAQECGQASRESGSHSPLAQSRYGCSWSGKSLDLLESGMRYTCATRAPAVVKWQSSTK